ncbi:hypothetical protein A2U01_0106246, partial [Trifolium medium]|nr:hypothetical protein [Trifolium medium]
MGAGFPAVTASRSNGSEPYDLESVAEIILMYKTVCKIRTVRSEME